MFTFIVYDGNEYLKCTMNVDSIKKAQSMMPAEHEILFAIEGDVDINDADGFELEELEV